MYRLSNAMARCCAAIALFFAPVALSYAQTEAVAALGDDYRAALYAPSTLPWSVAEGFAIEARIPEDPTNTSGSLLLNGKNVSYAIHVDKHGVISTPAVGFKIIDELAIGLNARLRNFVFHEIDFLFDVLARPWQFLSINAQYQLVDLSDSFFNASVGVRPIPGYLSDRVSLGVATTFDVADTRFYLPRVEVRTEFVDGIHLNGGYDFDAQAGFATLAIDYATTKVGSTVRARSALQNFDSATVWAHITPDANRSVLSSPPNRIVRITGGAVVDQSLFNAQSVFASFNGTNELVALLQQMDTVCTDRKVSALLFENSSYIASFANFYELYHALQRCKEAGKKIIFYNRRFGNLNYMLAAATADEIITHPAGSVLIKGFSSLRLYLHDFLESIGVDVALFRSHPHKSFGNVYSESAMTDAEREILTRLLESLQASYREIVRAGRGAIFNEQLDEIIDGGPYLTADTAHALGLVDKLLFEHDLEAYLMEQYPHTTINDYRQFRDLAWQLPAHNRVAILYAAGNITDGGSVRGATVGPDDFIAALQRAADAEDIKAIVIRIDSGGGSALASQSIANAIYQAREKKPIIAWMGGAAASGGYYIAAACDYIVASPVTITGSIGVVALVPNISGLLGLLRIQWDGVRTSPSADFLSPFRPLSATEADKFTALIAASYGDFVDAVTRYRDVQRAEVERNAQGKVWSGNDALALGLIDGVGHYQDVIAIVQEKINSDKPIRLINYEHASYTFFAEIGLLFQDLIGLSNIPHEIQILFQTDNELLYYEPWAQHVSK